MKGEVSHSLYFNQSAPCSALVSSIHMASFIQLYFDEEFDGVQVESDEEPTRSAQRVGLEHVGVGDVVEQVGEGHVSLEDAVAAVDEDAIHAWENERRSRPHLQHNTGEVRKGEERREEERRRERERRRRDGVKKFNGLK